MRQRQHNADGGSLVWCAFDFERATVNLAEAFRDEQAQPGALLLIKLPSELHVGADVRNLFRSKAAALIGE